MRLQLEKNLKSMNKRRKTTRMGTKRKNIRLQSSATIATSHYEGLLSPFGAFGERAGFAMNALKLVS